MLELGYFRSRHSPALIVTFVAFFGIFSIFFLRLSTWRRHRLFAYGWRWSSSHDPRHDRRRGLAGRRVALGSRGPMAEGCVLAGAGMLLSEVLLSAPRRRCG